MSPASPSRLSAANLSLRQLRAFVAVAGEASMTRAAARVHLTPSALSMLIRSMEDELGVRLFDRTTRRLVLTPAAEAFLPTVEQVFQQLESGLTQLHQHQQTEATQLRLATSPLLASGLFPQVIASLRTQHPQIRISLLDMPVESLPALVREGQVDLAVCTANSESADLKAVPLYVDKLMLVCPQSHALAERREVAWQDLLDEPLILLRHGSGLRLLVDKALAKSSRRVQTAYEVSQVATALALVAQGEGVSVLPSYAITRAQSAVMAGGVATVPLVNPVVEREIVALSAPGSVMSDAAIAFVEHFRRIAGKF